MLCLDPIEFCSPVHGAILKVWLLINIIYDLLFVIHGAVLLVPSQFFHISGDWRDLRVYIGDLISLVLRYLLYQRGAHTRRHMRKVNWGCQSFRWLVLLLPCNLFPLFFQRALPNDVIWFYVSYKTHLSACHFISNTW